MTPPDPANDERPPLWPGMSRRAEERFWFWFSLAVIAGLVVFAIAVLDTRHWVGVGITIGVGFFVMLVGGLWRALIGGRS